MDRSFSAVVVYTGDAIADAPRRARDLLPGRLVAGSDWFEVEDTRKYGGGVFLHVGRFHGPVLQVGDLIQARVLPALAEAASRAPAT